MISALALLLVACGGDDASEPENRTPAELAGDQAVGGVDSGADDGAGEEMDLAAMTDGDCLKVGNAMTGVLGRGVVGDFEADLATLRSFTAGAPDDAQPQIETFLDAYEASYQMLEDAGLSLTDVEAMQAESAQEIVNDATELVETPEVEAGMQAAEDFLFETCPVLS